MPPLLKDRRRFWSKVNKSGPLHPVLKTRCWLWMASCDTIGYGQFSFLSKSFPAHRFCWWITNGPIPPDMEICHHCDVRSCVNPAHLFMGTHADNLRDCRDKGRLKTPDNSGENMGWAKLTDEIVILMRRLYRKSNRWHKGCGYVDLAKRFNVHPVTVLCAVRGYSWKHLPSVEELRCKEQDQ